MRPAKAPGNSDASEEGGFVLSHTANSKFPRLGYTRVSMYVFTKSSESLKGPKGR